MNNIINVVNIIALYHKGTNLYPFTLKQKLYKKIGASIKTCALQHKGKIGGKMLHHFINKKEKINSG